MTSEPVVKNPYPGPRPFEEGERNIFFGRNREVKDIFYLITANPAVLLYAQSGAGKTSLLNAGLIPMMKEEDNEFDVLPVARIRSFEPEGMDTDNIYVFNALMSWAGEESRSECLASMSLADFLNEYPRSEDQRGVTLPLVAIFDQFEEIFTFYPRRWEERKGFFKQMAQALEEDPTLRVLFVIREDYLANLLPYAEHLPDRLNTRYRLERLREPAALSAVESPLEHMGCSFGPGVAASLVQELLKIHVRDASGEIVPVPGEYVEPVQLQIVCQSLWVNLPTDVTVITSGHLQAFGDVEEALRIFYERAIETASAKTGIKKDELRGWFSNELITQDGTRGTVFRGDERTGSIPNEAVDMLEDQHIVRAEMRAGGRWYELIHDRLTGPIRKANEAWLAEEQRREAEVERQRADEERKRADEQARINTKLRLWVAGFFVLFLSALFAGAYAIILAKKTEEQTKIAMIRKLASQSELMQNQQVNLLSRSVLLAVEAMRRSLELGLPSLEADQSLRYGLALLPRLLINMNHGNSVYSVSFSPDGKLLATGSWDKTARVWEVRTGQEIARMTHEDSVYSVSFSPDGIYLVTSSANIARVWDARTGREIAHMNHGASISSTVFSPDGTYLATGSSNTARVWEARTGTEVARMNHEGSVYSVSFSPNGELLATGSSDRAARVWEIKTGREIAHMNHGASISSTVFSPDGIYLATGSSNTARVWEIKTSTEVARMTHEDSISSVSFSPNGKLLATGSLDKTAKVWEVRTGTEVAHMNHEDSVYSVSFSPNGELLATGSLDKTASVWEVRTGTEVARMNHEDSVYSVSFSPDGRLLATGSLDKTAKVWEVRTGTEVARMNHEGGVHSVSFSPDGKLLATGSLDKTAKVWEVRTGTEVTHMNHEGGIYSVSFSPDGKLLATGSSDKVAKVWEVRTGTEVAHMNHEDSVYSVSFSPDGKLLATGSSNTARIWEIRTSTEVARMNHRDSVYSVSFGPDGKLLATGSWDRTARVWEARTGQEVVAMNHEDSVYSVSFSPDGKLLATGSWDRTARMWEVRTGNEIARMDHEGSVYSVSFGPDGELLATGSSDRTARVWRIRTGTEVARMAHKADVYSVSFSPDGELLATSSEDKVAQVWISSPETLIAKACSYLVRNLTQREWRQYLGEEPYRKTCPDLP